MRRRLWTVLVGAVAMLLGILALAGIATAEEKPPPPSTEESLVLKKDSSTTGFRI